MEQLPENIIKENFFGLSYSRQLKILDLYLIELKGTPKYDELKKTFIKYATIIKKFDEFKTIFPEYNDEERKNLREIIKKSEQKIKNNKQFLNNKELETEEKLYKSLYSPKRIEDSFVDKYINDSYSYRKERKKEIALELLDYYKCIKKIKFNQTLKLCEGNKNLFDNEIRLLSKDLYSKYIFMDTIEKMLYIWYISHYNLQTDKQTSGIQQQEYIELFSENEDFKKQQQEYIKQYSKNIGIIKRIGNDKIQKIQECIEQIFEDKNFKDKSKKQQILKDMKLICELEKDIYRLKQLIIYKIVFSEDNEFINPINQTSAIQQEKKQNSHLQKYFKFEPAKRDLI